MGLDFYLNEKDVSILAQLRDMGYRYRELEPVFHVSEHTLRRALKRAGYRTQFVVRNARDDYEKLMGIKK